MNWIKSQLRHLWHVPLINKAVHTFWQAFAAVFVLGISGNISSLLNVHAISDATTVLTSIVIAGIAAALSALKTFLASYFSTGQPAK